MEPAIRQISMKSLNYPGEEDKGSRVHMADPCGALELSFGTIEELELSSNSVRGAKARHLEVQNQLKLY